MVVGHNPTIERLQAWLTEDDRGFPAGAAAIVEFEGRWADLEPGDARLVDFTVPDLAGRSAVTASCSRFV